MRDPTIRDPILHHILGDLAKLLQWAYHDGYAEPGKNFWEVSNQCLTGNQPWSA
jgi:hypothetical protein